MGHCSNHTVQTFKSPGENRVRCPRGTRCGSPLHKLDREKLTPLLKLKYRNAIADAVADLGRPEEIGYLFTGFQKYLYQQASAISSSA